MSSTFIKTSFQWNEPSLKYDFTYKEAWHHQITHLYGNVAQIQPVHHLESTYNMILSFIMLYSCKNSLLGGFHNYWRKIYAKLELLSHANAWKSMLHKFWCSIDCCCRFPCNNTLLLVSMNYVVIMGIILWVVFKW